MKRGGFLKRKTPMKRTTLARSRVPLRKISKLSRERLKKYGAINRAFLADKAGKPCPVAREIKGEFEPINQTHHIKGRAGDLLFDTQFFLAVSQFGQDWIHAHPSEARKRGWLMLNACIVEAMEVFASAP